MRWFLLELTNAHGCFLDPHPPRIPTLPAAFSWPTNTSSIWSRLVNIWQSLRDTTTHSLIPIVDDACLYIYIYTTLLFITSSSPKNSSIYATIDPEYSVRLLIILMTWHLMRRGSSALVWSWHFKVVPTVYCTCGTSQWSIRAAFHHGKLTIGNVYERSSESGDRWGPEFCLVRSWFCWFVSWNRKGTCRTQSECSCYELIKRFETSFAQLDWTVKFYLCCN